MKKVIIQVICLIIAVFLFACKKESKLLLFVAPNGNDSNPGSIEQPLATIEKARDIIREIRDKGELTDTVNIILREGVYPIRKTIEFSEKDAGKKDAPIMIKSFENEEVIISGGFSVSSSGFVPVDDNGVLARIVDTTSRSKIVQIDLKALGISDFGTFKQHGFSTSILPAPMELFINDKPMVLAKWPNNGIVHITKVIDTGSIPYNHDFANKGGTIEFDYERARYWNNADNIWLWGYFGAGYADDNLGVEHIDLKNKTIRLKHASMFGIKKSDSNEEWAGRIIGYYAYNLLEEIDMPGEYFIDHKTGILYLYPPKDFQDAKIYVSIMEEPLLAIENTSNIRFSDIIFECGRGMGIYLEGGENIVLQGCTMRNFGTIALMMGKGIGQPDYPIHELTANLVLRRVGNIKAHQYENCGFSNNAGKNHLIKSCKMYHLGSGGMVLSGGDRKKLIPANNTVENCEIYSYNRRNKTYCAGITIWGVGNKIRHCYIHKAPHQAIALFGNEHIIEYNHIQEVVKYVNDMGAICIGRNPSERGNIIRYNFFDNLGSEGYKNCAIMLDDGTSDVLIEGNIFYKCSRFNFGAITFNGGCDNIVRNNIFIDGAHTIWIEDRKLSMTDTIKFKETYTTEGLWGKRLFKDINMNSKEWREKYPDFEPFYENGEARFLKNLEFYNNVIVREKLFISKHNLDSTAFKVFKNNYQTKTNPGFENFKEKNFSLKKNSEIFKKIPGFVAPPFNKIGLYGEEK